MAMMWSGRVANTAESTDHMQQFFLRFRLSWYNHKTNISVSSQTKNTYRKNLQNHVLFNDTWIGLNPDSSLQL